MVSLHIEYFLVLPIKKKTFTEKEGGKEVEREGERKGRREGKHGII